MNIIKNLTLWSLLLVVNNALASQYVDAYKNAIISNQPDIIEELLDIGMDINLTMGDQLQSPPINLALQYDQLTLAQYLIKKGADVNRQDAAGYNALGALLTDFPPRRHNGDKRYLNAVKCLELILPNIKNINHLQGKSYAPGLRNYGHYGTPAISMLISAGRDNRLLLEKLKLILKYKPDVNLEDYQGKTPLVNAILINSPDVVELLLNHGANPNHSDTLGTTILMFSASRGQLPIVKLLVEHGAKVTKTTNSRGQSVLGLAASSGNIKLLKYIKANLKD